METDKILIYVIGTAVIVLLILSIIIAYLAIMLMKRLNQTAESAKTALHNVETTMESLKETVKITSIGATFAKGFMSILKNKRSRK